MVVRARPWRIYVDTAVIGGCLDAECAAGSPRLIEAAQRGQVVLLLSDIVTGEVAKAPPAVQAIIDTLPDSAMEQVPIDDAVGALRDAYIAAGIVRARSLNDAGHVAAATVARADANRGTSS